MNLVNFAESLAINFKKSAGTTAITFEAGKDYVMPFAQLNRILGDAAVNSRLFKCSRIENRIQNFNVSARKVGTQRLLLFNGSGGYGDQVLTWPFAKILSTLGFEVHILTDPGNQSCWWNFPWVKSVNVTPIPYEHFKMYDYHAMFEAVVNTDEHQDQKHPLDVMLAKVGIDPNQVDPALKVVPPNFTFSEMQSTRRFESKKFGIFQLSCANPVRSLTPSNSAYLLLQLAEEFPDIHWYAISDEFVPKEYSEMLVCRACDGKNDPYGKVCPTCEGQKVLAKNIELYTSQSLRELWAMTTRAQIVVAPDSMMVHVAGALGVPCVGLWGMVDPMNRVRYYTKHAAVWKRKVCPFSPCYAYAATFPKYCPPANPRVSCDVLAAITPKDVIDAVRSLR